MKLIDYYTPTRNNLIDTIILVDNRKVFQRNIHYNVDSLIFYFDDLVGQHSSSDLDEVISFLSSIKLSPESSISEKRLTRFLCEAILNLNDNTWIYVTRGSIIW